MLRQNKDYLGFKINSCCFKVSLFADDTIIYLNGNAFQFNYVFDILNYFENKLECKVNLSKSGAFYKGSSREKNNKPFFNSGLFQPDTSFTYLGVNILISKFDELSLFKKSFANIVHDMQSILNLWSVRGLTLLDKITFFKTLVISKIIHKAFHLPMHLPQAFTKHLDKSKFKFLVFGAQNWKKIVN